METPDVPIEEWFQQRVSVKRDLNEHMEELARLAGTVDHVTEFSTRRESQLAFYMGLVRDETSDPQKLKLVSYNSEFDPVVFRESNDATTPVLFYDHKLSNELQEIEETDLLFLDQTHTYQVVFGQLNKFHEYVRRYIVLHDTQLFDKQGEDGGQGLLEAVRNFLKANPKWSVIKHYKHQHGLTVLGCLPEDKPELPPITEQGKNFIGSMWKHYSTGAKTADDATTQIRLDTCATCEHRVDNRCSQCGCVLDDKIAMETSECPLGLWQLNTPPTGSA